MKNPSNYDKTIEPLKNSPRSIILAILAISTLIWVADAIQAWETFAGFFKQEQPANPQIQAPVENNQPKNEAQREPYRLSEMPDNSRSSEPYTSPAKKPPAERPVERQPDMVPPPAPTRENYSSYVNAILTNTPGSVEVAVVIADPLGRAQNAEASAIAGIYNQSGKKTGIGLLKSAFLKKSEFSDLCDGDSDLMREMNLQAHADYIALGRLNYAFREGTLVGGTVVCTATLEMSILSTATQSLVKSFTISNVNGNGATRDQAQENARYKLLSIYNDQHASL